jgi:hypothetical protein
LHATDRDNLDHGLTWFSRVCIVTPILWKGASERFSSSSLPIH